MASVPDGCLQPLDALAEDIPRKNSVMRILGLFGSLREELAPIRFAQQIPLIIGLDASTHLTGKNDAAFLRHMAAMAGIDMDNRHSKLIANGRASGLLAVIEAIKLIESGRTRAVLTGGCDTYKDIELLSALDHEARLKSEANRDGFIPGEGVGLLLLTEGPAKNVHITATASGFEPGHIYSSEPYLGQGLFQTLKALFQNRRFAKKIETVYSSMNGESYWVKEWGVASIRLTDHFSQNYRFEHPADCYGDLGAAAGPVMAGIAVDRLNNSLIKGPALVYASSDHGERAALIIEKIKA
jgi:3-oxoacyl-[acyl-carrier-protein] synthase-1